MTGLHFDQLIGLRRTIKSIAEAHKGTMAQVKEENTTEEVRGK